MALFTKSIRSVDDIIAPVTAAIGSLDKTRDELQDRALNHREAAAKLTEKALIDENESVRAGRLADVFTKLITEEGEIA